MADSSLSDLISALTSKAPRIALGVAAGQAAWPAYKGIREWLRNRREYTIKVPDGSDGLYDDLQSAILGMLSTEERNSLVASAARSPDDDESRRLQLAYDGSKARTVTIGGHKVEVWSKEAELEKNKGPELWFTTPSPAARDAVLARIDACLKAGPGRPVFKMINRWGNAWDRLQEMPSRSLDSVILPPGQLERIINDIQVFLDSERLYLQRNIPWHRAHLYEGPPGTGKTSLAKAVADHFGLDVYYLPLADLEKDSQLTRTVLDIRPRSLLVIEDIDVFSAATKRTDDEDAGATLSGLLNALDGIATPHGLITVMTSNHPELLDEALLRPGRVDLREHFAPAGPVEIDRLVSHWYGQSVRIGLPAGTAIAPAQVVETCKRCPHPDDVIMELLSDNTLMSVA